MPDASRDPDAMDETTNEPTEKSRSKSAVRLRIAAFVLCATTLGTAAASGAPAQDQEPPVLRASAPADAWAAKVEAAIDDAGAHPDAVARALSALGPRAIPAIFAAFAGEGPYTGTTANDEFAPAAPPRRRTGLLRALERVPFADLRAHLESLALAAPPSAVRRAAIEVLGVSGSAQELELSIRFASPPEGAPADATLLPELI